ncbi:hypothetical protein RKE29_19185 [Streptomyces sp. B1866]|uniref:hypothetical protein n=1 Tax=Streptomyces sp. B1866 TaxID=3075431 RepID=UPI00288F8BD7|nr:hypothetical protein [Streptomyces sp. B1866]MDT3398744.1 hypothetical protein [Streptomyces sp. B1866]
MALFGRRRAGRPGEWYYCLRDGRVEEGPECRAADRMGPYASRAEAERAMETAAERNARWEHDPRWHDGAAAGEEGEGSGGGGTGGGDSGGGGR